VSTRLDEHFDAVVVGSGFGGSVTAYRLAEAGKRVCLLERGKPYPPGSFPRTPAAMARNFWDPSEGRLGMFNVWSFSGIDALVSSGLGGGSLIYANVMIRKDERWFVHDDGEHWPLSRADLEPHYDRCEAMLAVQKYPLDREPYSSTRKTRAFEQAAKNLGYDWFLPDLAVTFANPGDEPVPGEPIREEHPNLHGRTRFTCRLVGECDVGCNYGSKNSLDFTYLSAAARNGAELRTLSEVRTFRPRDGGGFEIDYVHHDEAREGAPVDTHDPRVLPVQTITADRLVLSAGTLGTTFLLLRNRNAFGGSISSALGTRFSGNGDLLTFAMRCTEERGGRRVPLPIDADVGPVITSAIRFGDAADGDGSTGRGFYVEDAGYPNFLAWMLQGADEPRALWMWRHVAFHAVMTKILRRPQPDVSGLVSDFFGDSALAGGLLPLLGMGRDVPDGVMRLGDGKLDVDWSKDGASKPYFERLRHAMETLAGELGGRFQDNPLWWLSKVITVHALGGCPMGRDASEGVIDPWGQVFGVPGLHVADGSAMPGPVGANPSLTIAAVADRFSDAILEGREHDHGADRSVSRS
jgi:cholesterol oxidase